MTSLSYGEIEGFYVGQIDIFCGTIGILSGTIFLDWASVTFDQDGDQKVYPWSIPQLEV